MISKNPARKVATEFNMSATAAEQAHRTGVLPPGGTAAKAAKFLEVTANKRETTMPSTWEPPASLAAAEREIMGADKIYDCIMDALKELGAKDKHLRVDVASYSLAVGCGALAALSGLAWTTPGISRTLRKIADDIDATIAANPQPAEIRTLHELFRAGGTKAAA
jgi:hypothetical protein